MMVTHVDSDNSQPSPSRKEPVLLIELHAAASPIVIPTIRTVAADLAARVDFDLDSIDDLRMAVDDACAMLVPMAAANATLSCTFTVWDERIELAAEVEADDSADPLPTGSFGWRILESLADEVSGLFSPGALGKGGRVRITLAKSALTAPQP